MLPNVDLKPKPILGPKPSNPDPRPTPNPRRFRSPSEAHAMKINASQHLPITRSTSSKQGPVTSPIRKKRAQLPSAKRAKRPLKKRAKRPSKKRALRDKQILEPEYPVKSVHSSKSFKGPSGRMRVFYKLKFENYTPVWWQWYLPEEIPKCAWSIQEFHVRNPTAAREI